jgi:hypothetical protein
MAAWKKIVADLVKRRNGTSGLVRLPEVLNFRGYDGLNELSKVFSSGTEVMLTLRGACWSRFAIKCGDKRFIMEPRPSGDVMMWFDPCL